MGELVILLLVVLVQFGAGRLPRAGAGLGKAVRRFKDALAGKDERRPDGEEGGGAPGGGKAAP
jgi:TatA/E family protein of Tat protein translocase